MTDDRGSNWDPLKRKEGGNDTALPVRYVRDRLRETENVIRSLKGDLSYYRGQNNEISRERDGLLKLLAQKDQLSDDRSRFEEDFKTVKAERDKLYHALRPMEEENKRLVEYCARLETQLRSERERYAEAQEVIVYLEAQIEQLEGMVAMLREHKTFMRGE